MQNIEQIIKITKESISESGKSLQQNGVKDSNSRISIYRKLQEMYSTKMIMALEDYFGI